MQVAIQQADKPVFLVEGPRLLVDCGHFDGMDTQLVSEVQATSKGIDEERLTESLALGSLIDGEAGEQDHRDRVLGKFPGGGHWKLLKRDCARSQRVIAVDTILARLDGDVGAAQVALSYWLTSR